MKDKIRSIPYCEPFLTGDEHNHLQIALKSGGLSGDGFYSKKCTGFFKDHFGFKQGYLTSSCSLAIEIAVGLCNLNMGDEVIIPSFAYVTDAIPFVKTGAQVVFADSEQHRPHIDPAAVERLINSRTKVLLVIHYAGVACNMTAIMKIVKEHGLILIEDCAQAIGVSYDNRSLGTFGSFSTFSFHETKNIQCGEGGLLVVNNKTDVDLADELWREGTNRKKFEQGLVRQYEWTSLGSSYQPSELTAAFLYGQLPHIEHINKHRTVQWEYYFLVLSAMIKEHTVGIKLPAASTGNGHIFYVKLESKSERDLLMEFLNRRGVNAVFHYLPLHLSPFWLRNNKETLLKNAEDWSNKMLRLPLYYNLKKEDQDYIAGLILKFFQG